MSEYKDVNNFVNNFWIKMLITNAFSKAASAIAQIFDRLFSSREFIEDSKRKEATKQIANLLEREMGLEKASRFGISADLLTQKTMILLTLLDGEDAQELTQEAESIIAEYHQAYSLEVKIVDAQSHASSPFSDTGSDPALSPVPGDSDGSSSGGGGD